MHGASKGDKQALDKRTEIEAYLGKVRPEDLDILLNSETDERLSPPPRSD
jgi:hypothetical protein